MGEVEFGDQRRFTGFIRDITKRREAEEQLRTSLQRIQEIQAEFNHVSRLSAMGEMAATLAHELNQPLTAVMNYVQAGRRVMKSDRPDVHRKKSRMCCPRHLTQAHRAGEIIRRLRSFVARGETEKMPDDINEVVADACDLALVGARTEGVAFTTQFDGALRPVLIDRVQIQQVVVNLLRNSIDALEGRPDAAIQVTTRQESDAVRVAVADNGPGLDKEIADKLFESFNTSKPDGMGIGLSVSRSIVEDHGGRIDAVPRSGRRGRVLVHSPVGGIAMNAMEQIYTVYIVDDDEAVRDSLQVLLDAVGYETQTFSCGPDFLDACDSGFKGCVLLDVRMPQMSGLEVQERLKSVCPDLPVIIITGHGDIAMAVGAMKAGALDFVEKPFHEETLLASIEAALKQAEQTDRQKVQSADAQRNIERLTPREHDVLEQLVIGRPNKVIAYELGCSPRTVEIHRARIMEKTGAKSLSHLVRLSLAAGIDPDSE